MAVVANADEYANARVGIFFPANNQTPADGNLTGQCVTLVKWFLAEMTSVPNPFSARGDARYVGKRLVAEGHAIEVPYADRKRGDIVTYEYGVYGHIGVILSGNRTFEENVNIGGVASKIVDGARVYASRIGSMAETWRHDIHIYRVNSYNEGGSNVDTKTKAKQLGDIHRALTGSDITQKDLDFYIQRPDGVMELTYGLFPKVQSYRDGIKMLENERDKVLYPYVEHVSSLLGIPANALKLDVVTDAVNKLKAGANPDIKVLAPGDYRVK